MLRSQRYRKRSVALLPFLLSLLLLAPSVGAQVPDPPEVGDEEIYAAQILSPKSSVSVDYLGNQIVNLTIEDVSMTNDLGTTQYSGQIFLQAYAEGRPRGWLASMGTTQIVTRPGQTHDVTVNIQAGATIQDPVVHVIVEAVYVAPTGERNPTNMTILAVARPNPVVQMQLDGAPPDFSPDERKQVPITVRNDDYYPEMISFNAQAPDGWVVSPPSSIQLGPGEERTVFVHVKAPEDPWFRLNPTSDVFILEAETQTNSGGRYAIGVPTPISGSFLPGWVIGHIVLLAIGLAVAARRSSRRVREHKLEKGKPEFPGLPPEKEARYEALKITDPERADRMKATLKKRHKKRKEKWKDVYKERKRREKELRQRAKQRHDAILAEQRREEKERKKRERERRRKLRKLREKKREKQKELRKKKEAARERREKARQAEEERLTGEMRRKREQKEKRLRELRKRKRELQEQERAVEEAEQAADDEGPSQAEIEAKRRRLEELRERKRELEEQREGTAEEDQEGST